MIYLDVEHNDGEDVDYWTFDTFGVALAWLEDCPIDPQEHFWAMSNRPIGLPESEYTHVPMEDVLDPDVVDILKGK